MTPINSKYRRRLRPLTLGALVVGAALAGCSDVTEPLLRADDPDIVDPTTIRDADGAEGLRVGTLGRLSSITSGGESMFLFGGLLTDEWKSGDTFIQRDETDKRTVDSSNTLMTTAHRNLHRARLSSQQTISALREFRPAPATSIGQMFFVMGFAENMLGEHFCSGQPFSTVVGTAVEEGAPLTTQQVFERAAATMDSAIASYAGSADSVRVRDAARITKARALVNLGRFPEAAAVVGAGGGFPRVADNYRYLVTHSQLTVDNQIWALNNNARRYVVSDTTDARNALPFASVNDPRVPVTRRPTTPAFDGVTLPSVQQNIWPVRDSSVAIVTGIEARLIEAEAAYQANPAGTAYLTILNALRSSATTLLGRTATLPALTDPGTPAARVNLIFRERAFWLFSTGHRLGDLRRLVRQYGRTQDTVFPTGRFPKGGDYGTDVNFPTPQAERNNTKFQGCINRGA